MIKLTLFTYILLVIAALVVQGKRVDKIHTHGRRSDASESSPLSSSFSSNPEKVCMGEFQMCPTGECSLLKSSCIGTCPPGFYVCPPNPLNTSAPPGCAPQFSKCPNLQGTFWDWTLDTETRLDLLASQVPIDEQTKQLTNFAPAIRHLGIPEYQWLNDDLHGLRGNWTTSFPDGVGLGATWDAALLKQVGYTISLEAREVHHFYTSRGVRGVDNPIINGIGLTAYAPNINIGFKPRWGRNQEVYSECPTHTKILAKNYIKGMQFERTSNVTNKKYLQGIACSKHYLAYDVESDPIVRYKYNAIVNGRNLFETYLPAFYGTVVEANVRSVMPSYNSVNGVPAACAGNYMNYLMREKWNYTGWFVSDYDAWVNILATHAYVPTLEAAAAIGINNGLDQEGGGWTAISALPQCLKDGTVKAATVTASFKRLFRARFQLGMFDPPEFLEFFSNLNSRDVGDDTNEKLALQAALESATMFRNVNGNTIPLDVAEGGDFTLVVGPKAASTAWIEGNYATKPRSGTVSALEGILNFECPWNSAWGMNVTYGYSIYATPDWTQQYAPKTNVESIEACQNLCQGNLRCNYYTYISKQKQCYLLPVQGPLVPNPAAVSGARHGLVVVRQGVTYAAEGSDIAVPADDSRECSQRCRVDSYCSRFTFDKTTGSCWLLPAHRDVAIAAPSTTVSGESPVKCSAVRYAEACSNSDLHCNLPLGFDKAVELAASATNTIVLFGLDQSFESEGHDRSTIDLPANWYILLNLLRASVNEGGGRLIGVMIHGGSFRIDTTIFDGLIDLWYPGQLGGKAIAQVLYGQYAPAGRSAITWYKSDADLPATLAYQDLYPNTTTGFQGISYRYFTGAVSIPFGFGLTLTQFQYSNLVVEPLQVFGCQVINVSFTVAAVGGAMMGYSDEVAQVYIQQQGNSVPVPQVRLVNFTRLRNVPAGEGVRVTLQIQPRDRTVIYQNDAAPHLSQEALESGALDIFVGGGQPSYFSGGLSEKVSVLVGGSIPVDHCN